MVRQIDLYAPQYTWIKQPQLPVGACRGACRGYIYLVLGACRGHMSWVYVVGVCRGCMPWAHAVGACRGCMSWVQLPVIRHVQLSSMEDKYPGALPLYKTLVNHNFGPNLTVPVGSLKISIFFHQPRFSTSRSVVVGGQIYKFNVGGQKPKQQTTQKKIHMHMHMHKALTKNQ